MIEDPYSILIEEIRREAEIVYTPLLFTGVVISPFPDLLIKTQSLEIDKDNLYIDKWLLDRDNTLNTDIADQHSHSSDSYKDALKVGDRVVLFRQGDIFYILNKVVKL